MEKLRLKNSTMRVKRQKLVTQLKQVWLAPLIKLIISSHLERGKW